MRFRTQTLGETLLEYGRCWLRLASWPARSCFRAGWRLGGKSFRFMITWGGCENDLSVSVALPFLGSAHVGMEYVLPEGWMNRNYARCTGIRVFDWKIWIDIWNDDSWGGGNTVKWTDPSTWGRTTGYSFHGPKYPWSSMTFDPLRFLLGRMEVEKKDVREERVRVPMPEGNYDATVTLYRQVWARERLPWSSQVAHRAEIEPDEPIGVPGKGTTAYNCGDDAIYALTCNARRASEAAGKLAERAMDTRERHPV